jgi:hypothetical protein
MKKNLTKRDLPWIATALVLLLVGLGASSVARQKMLEDQEQHRMIKHMKEEMGMDPNASTEDSMPESEGQQDPHFMP